MSRWNLRKKQKYWTLELGYCLSILFLSAKFAWRWSRSLFEAAYEMADIVEACFLGDDGDGSVGEPEQCFCFADAQIQHIFGKRKSGEPFEHFSDISFGITVFAEKPPDSRGLAPSRISVSGVRGTLLRPITRTRRQSWKRHWRISRKECYQGSKPCMETARFTFKIKPLSVPLSSARNIRLICLRRKKTPWKPPMARPSISNPARSRWRRRNWFWAAWLVCPL